MAETKELFMRQGFIDANWGLLNWNRRQFLSDSSTDRVRRHREAMKQDETLHVTKGNVTETPSSVSVSVSGSVSEGITPEMMARGLAERLGLSLGYGPASFNTAVTEVAETELKAGRNLEDLCTEMEAAYRFYLQEKPFLRIAWGPANFFGQGHWREPDSWPRKEKSRQRKISEWRAPVDEAE